MAALRRLLAALTILCVALCVLAAPQPAAQAQTAPASAANSVGSISSVKPPASITRNDRTTPLKVGDDVFQNDVLETGIGGALGVSFDDETTFTLNANASITVNDFVYQKGGGANKAAISVVRGTAAFFASQVAKTGDMKINTPTATLGIRGTSGVIEVPDGSRPGAQTQVKLYQDASGSVGRIEVFGRDSTQQLGLLTQAATGFAIAREAARFAAIPLVISAQQAALDRNLVQRVFSLQRGIGKQLLNARILRIPELQRRLNFQNLQRIPSLQPGRQIQRAPSLPRPSIPSGPGGLVPRLPSIPNIGR